MIDNNLINLYKELSLNDKRNEFSSLLQKTDILLSEILSKNSINVSSNTKNYSVSSDNNMSEDDMLSFFYEDLWNIKNKLLILMTCSTPIENGEEQEY